MNVLFMNRDSGCGVEFEGNLFIDILKRTVGIDNIDVYKSQCQNVYRNFDFSVYDLIILNDLSINEYEQDKLDVGVPVININFGGVGNRSEVIDIVLDINMPYTCTQETDIFNYYPLSFISGNIWENKNKWDNRSSDILYVGRLSKEKIMQSFIDSVKEQNKTIDFYGPITDNDYYELNRNVINYKGYVDHRELVDIYNKYKAVYLFSTTECLSMTLREAILCGTVPVVYDTSSYTKTIEEYCVFCDDGKFQDVSEKIERKHKYIEKQKRYISNLLSFDKMILDFIFCLRGLLLKDFKFNVNYRANMNVMEGANVEVGPYKNDSVDWNKIKI
jgi:glycosyltransferase involved in cell wall biosynthesis